MAESNSNPELKELLAAISTGGKQTDNTAAMMVDINVGSNIEKILVGLQEFASMQTDYLKQLAFRDSKSPAIESILLADNTTVDGSSNLQTVLNSINKFASMQTDYLKQLVSYFAGVKQTQTEKSVTDVPQAQRGTFTSSFAESAGSRAGSLVGGGFGMGSLLENLGSTLGGTAGSIAGIGVGIAGLLVSLAGADWAAKQLGDGVALKNLIINLGEGLSSLDTQALASLGVLVGTSALFAANTSFGTQVKTATGMTALGIGIGGFLAGIASVMDLAQFVGVDGSGVKTQLTNLAEGLNAFSTQSLTALGTLLTATTLFSVVAGPAGAAYATTGLAMIGLGIGGFIAGLVGATDAAKALGADGSGLKSQLTNIAAGMNALGQVEWTKVGSAGDALASLGYGMGVFFSAQGLGAIGSYTTDAIDSIKNFSNWLFGTDLQTSDKKPSAIQQIVDSLGPLNDLSDDMITKMDSFGAAINRFVSSFESLANIKSGGITTNLESMLRGIGALLDAQKPLINGGTWYGQRWGFGDNIYFGEEGEGGLKNLTDENVNIIRDGVTKLYGAMGIPMPATPTVTAPTVPESPLKGTQPSIIVAPINGPAGQPGPVITNSNNTNTTIIQKTQDPSGSLMLQSQMLGGGYGDVPIFNWGY